MSWVRVDDHFYDHAKWATAPGDSIALWLAAMAWCNRNDSYDGFIPANKLAGLVNIRNSKRTAADLCERVAFEKQGDGYLIHDYAEYQQNDKVRQIRDARSAAGRKGARARWGKNGTEIANPIANEKQVPWQTDGNENAPRPTTHGPNHISDDDDSADTPDPTSSSVEQIISTTALAIALKDRERPARAYVNGIAKNLRKERLDEVNDCIDQHLSVHDAAIRLDADPWFVDKALNGSTP